MIKIVYGPPPADEERICLEDDVFSGALGVIDGLANSDADTAKGEDDA